MIFTPLIINRHIKNVPLYRFCLAGAASACLSAAASAQAPDWDYQGIWETVVLHRSESAFIRELDLSGRLQAETAWFDADEGDYDDTRWRRFRFGFKADLLDNWVAHLEADFDLNNSSGDWYNRLTDTYVSWSPGPDSPRLKVLKHSAGFTLDGATSSKRLLTLQRNNLTNNLWFTAEYFTGVSLAGRASEHLDYKVGVFSSDGDDEIGISEASYFTLGSVTWELAHEFDLETAWLRLDYVYNDEDRDANTRSLSHVATLSSQWQRGPWHLRTDLGWGDGHLGQSDLWGLVAMPYYDFSENLQAVLRYTYLDSDEDGGIRLNRYEREIVSGRGQTYHEIYLGLNWFLYGHKLKWQTGIQYTDMDSDEADSSYQGWGITTGPRIYW